MGPHLRCRFLLATLSTQTPRVGPALHVLPHLGDTHPAILPFAEDEASATLCGTDARSRRRLAPWQPGSDWASRRVPRLGGTDHAIGWRPARLSAGARPRPRCGRSPVARRRLPGVTGEDKDLSQRP